MLSELWSDLRFRLRALVRRADLDHELDAELEFHLTRAAEEYERQGVPAPEAQRRARLAFGSLEDTKERSRDMRGTALIESALQDARYAWRGLCARPAFAAGVRAHARAGDRSQRHDVRHRGPSAVPPAALPARP